MINISRGFFVTGSHLEIYTIMAMDGRREWNSAHHKLDRSQNLVPFYHFNFHLNGNMVIYYGNIVATVIFFSVWR